VLYATLTEQVPAKAGNGAGYTLEGFEEEQGFTRFFADYDFTETYGIALAAGRGLSEDYPTDSTSAFLVNEALVTSVGWSSPEEAVGKAITMEHAGQLHSGTIVGVTRDFHLFSLHQGISPVVINMMPYNKFNFVSLRLAPGTVQSTLDHLAESWSTFSPGYPFDYYFLDADYARLHNADAQLGSVFRAFAVLAVLVACLGLFGLAAFTAEQRTKEIGVRKVMGASVGGIVLLLSKDFTRLVAIAFLVAAPAAYLVMSRWLENFTFRTEINPFIFVLVGVLALAIAWLTVGYQAVRAATADPVRALRYE
jgi:putative ABC transport system permease protein